MEDRLTELINREELAIELLEEMTVSRTDGERRLLLRNALTEDPELIDPLLDLMKINSANRVGRNWLTPYGIVSYLLAFWYDHSPANSGKYLAFTGC